MKILMIQRAVEFSPNSVDKDLAILEAVANNTRGRFFCDIVSESDITKDARGLSLLCEAREIQKASPLCVLSMARRPETLQWLKTLKGVRIINSPESVENCSRSHLQQVMERLLIPIPPREGCDGYWLKRGDAAAQSQRDVVYAADRQALDEAIQAFTHRGIADYVVSAHVKGDLVKFYGVSGGFFRYYYPTDDGQTKFDDESRNGLSHHYSFDCLAMQKDAERLAETVGVEVYGGDCIIRADGSYCFIDFNDWPSFSRCREEAADAIARLVINSKNGNV